jgi:hypothetical protein
MYFVTKSTREMERRLCIPEHELILLESDTVIDSQSNKCIEQASASQKVVCERCKKCSMYLWAVFSLHVEIQYVKIFRESLVFMEH